MTKHIHIHLAAPKKTKDVKPRVMSGSGHWLVLNSKGEVIKRFPKTYQGGKDADQWMREHLPELTKDATAEFFKHEKLGSYKGFQLRSQVDPSRSSTQREFFGGIPGGRTYGPFKSLQELKGKIDSSTEDAPSKGEVELRDAVETLQSALRDDNERADLKTVTSAYKNARAGKRLSPSEYAMLARAIEERISHYEEDEISTFGLKRALVTINKLKTLRTTDRLHLGSYAEWEKKIKNRSPQAVITGSKEKGFVAKENGQTVGEYFPRGVNQMSWADTCDAFREGDKVKIYCPGSPHHGKEGMIIGVGQGNYRVSFSGGTSGMFRVAEVVAI